MSSTSPRHTAVQPAGGGIAPCELFENILHQPASIQSVVDHQFGPGREALREAAMCIRKTGQVILTGMGSSLFACVPLVNYLAARGVAATLIEAAELLHSGLGISRPGSAVLLASRSGDTVEVAKLLPALREKQVKTIGVTNVAESALAREAHYPVLVHSFTDQMVAIQTYVGTLVTLLILGAEICGEPEARWRGDLEALVRELSRFIPDCVQHSAGWRKFLDSPGAIYVLGRGASLGSVSEGALLFHETSKAAAVGMSAGHFRHGPVEVVNPEFRALIFATHSATQELDASLAADIRAIGGDARLIGADALQPGLHFCPWPAGVPEILAPAAEIVPVQIAALRLAQWRGIPAGEFRFAPCVTLSETGFQVPSSKESE